MQDNEIFKKILFIGPSLKAQGGISAVLNSYKTEIKYARFLSSTSAKGMFATYFVFMLAVIKLPFYRLFTGIKIVHIHSSSRGSWVRKSMLVKWTKLLGFKVVWHCHSGHFIEFAQSKGLDNVRNVLYKCSAIILLTDSWIDFFTKKLALSNVLVVKNIVGRPEKIERDANSPVINILFLGAIGKLKGVYDILEMAKQHKTELACKVKIIVGGNGENDKFTSMIEEYQISEIVEFVGWVAGDKKKQLLNSSHIMLLPSYVEGLPISILEGMAYKMPIITTPVGGIPDIVKDGVNGKFMTPGNVDELFEAINYYIKNRADMAQHGEVASQTISEYYSDSVVKSLAEMYNKIS
jgi:glycosyltransferase involved in cell wall biosynthesis